MWSTNFLQGFWICQTYEKYPVIADLNSANTAYCDSRYIWFQELDMTASLTEGDKPREDTGTGNFVNSPFFPVVIAAGVLLLLLVGALLVMKCR